MRPVAIHRLVGCAILAMRGMIISNGDCGMNQTLAEIRATALRLSESERAKLAHDLVESLDGTADAGALDEWDAELLRRLAEVESGTAKLLSRGEFRNRIRERLTKP